jgi:nitroimidazol reductase NimA-like FMN-containing flavoprotein (pyridoxamine 5'-phosphate oxidase superfamily)
MLGSLNQAQIDHVLQSNVIGRIGCHANELTYVVPVTYVYYGGCIYGHTVEGLKMRMIRKNPNVCFEVDQIQDYANWVSVIVWGTFMELKGEEIITGLKILSDGLSHHYLSHTSTPQAEDFGVVDEFPNNQINSIVYRIDITKKTGRFEKRS